MADGKVVIDTRLNTKGAESGVSKLKSTLSGIGSTAGKVASGGLKVATGALKGMGVAAIGLAGSVVKIGVSFDSSMSKVKAISGASAEEFDKLREKAIEMGNKTQFSATEAAEAMNYMAMAGWKTNNMLKGIDGIMNLAAASGEDLAKTSDIVTDGLTAFGMKAKESGRFADVLAAASVNANTNVSMLGESFKYVAPVAGAMGYNVEDTAVALGLMANAGIKASQSGTALRTLLTNMAKPTESMQGAMDKLGISLDDGHGHMKSFAEIMKDLRSGFGNLQISQKAYNKSLSELNAGLKNGDITQKQYDKGLEDLTKRAFGAEGAIKAETAATLAGKEGMSGLLAIVGASDKDFNKLTKAINNSEGAAEEMANTMNDNVEGAFKILVSNLQTLGIRIWDTFSGSLKGGVEEMQGFVTELTGAFEYSMMAGGGIEGFAEIAGQIIPKMISRLLEGAPDFINTGFMIITKLMEGFRNAIPEMQNSVSSIISSLSSGLTSYFSEFFLLGAEIIISIAKGFSENSGQIGQQVGNMANTIVTSIASTLPFLLQAGIEIIVSIANGISSHAGDMLTAITNAITQMVSYLSSNVGMIVEAGGNLLTGLIDGLMANAPSLLSAALDLLMVIIDAISQIIPKIQAELPKIIQGIVDYIGKPENQKKILEKALSILEGIITAIGRIVISIAQNAPKIVSALVDGIKNIPSALANILNLAIQKVKDWVSSLVKTGGDGSKSFLDKVIEFMSGLPSKIFVTLTKVIPKVVSWGANLVSKVPGIVGGFIKSFINLLGNLPSKALYALMFVITKIAIFSAKLEKKAIETAKGFINSFIKKIQELPGKIPGFVNDVIEALKSLPEKAPEIGGNILKGLWNGINGMKDWVIDKVKGMGESILDGIKDALGIHSPSVRAEKEVGANVAKGVGKGLEKNTKNPVSAAKKMAKKVIDAAKEATGASSWFEKATLTGEKAVKRWEQALSKLTKGTKEYSTAQKYLKEAQKQARQGLVDAAKEATDASGWFEKATLTGQDAVKKWQNTLNKLKKGTIEYAEAQKYLGKAQKLAKKEVLDAAIEATGAGDWFAKATLTAEQSVKKWQDTVSKFKKGTKEYKKAIKYLVEAEKQLEQEVLDAVIEATGAGDWFGEKTLNMVESVEKWEEMVHRFSDGSEEYITAQKYLGEAQKRLAEEQGNIITEYNNAQAEIAHQTKSDLISLKETMENEIKGLNDAYEDAVNKRAENIYKSMNLFDEFTSTTERTGDSMIAALKSQVAGLENYGSVLDSLAERGVSDKLLNELKEMGPDATADLEVLNGMTDAQLSEFVELWEQKGKLAHDQAVKDSESIRIDTEIEIEKTKALYAEKMKDVIEQSEKDMQDLKETYIKKLEDIGVDVGVKSKSNGSSLMDGFKEGIENKKTSILSYVQSVFSEIASTAKKELDINSPSKVFRKMGRQSLEGYALGWDDYDMVGQVRSTFKNGIDSLNDIAMSATITQSQSEPQANNAPTLIFNDVQTSPDAIYQKFYQQQTYGLARAF